MMSRWLGNGGLRIACVLTTAMLVTLTGVAVSLSQADDVEEQCEPISLWDALFLDSEDGNDRTPGANNGLFRQVAIEVKFITVEDRFFEQIGVDFDFNFNGVDCNRSFGNNGGFPDSGFDNDLPNPFRQSSLVDFPNPLFDPAPMNFGVAFPSDETIAQLLRAIRTQETTMIFQSPELKLANGQSANIADPRRNQHLFGWITEPGVGLSVRPLVSQNGEHIRLHVMPSANGFVPSSMYDAVGGEMLDGPGFPTIQVPFPDIEPTRLSTKVVVPDGDTVVLGGLVRDKPVGGLGIALLSRIPVIGRLFKNSGIGASDETLLILVTPRIIILDE